MKMSSLVWGAALLSLSGGTLTAQDRPLTPVVQGEVTRTTPLAYSLAVRAGDVTAGTITLSAGGPLAAEVLDASNASVALVEIDEPGTTDLAFVARTAGRFSVRIVGTTAVASRFFLNTTTESPASRMAGVHVAPTVRYRSERIDQLAADVQAGKPDALSTFWSEAASRGGPLVEPFSPTGRGGARAGGAGRGRSAGENDDVLVTFLWREIYDTYNVAVIRPPFSDTDYFMTRLPGTDVWYKTMRVHRSSRFSYTLAPNYRPGDMATAATDPLNRRCLPEGSTDCRTAFRSVLDLPGAPDESWARNRPPRQGSLAPHAFDSPSLGAQLSLIIYTPPEFAAVKGPYPLVILLDGTAYANARQIAAPTSLDNLIAAGRIRPAVVCFVSSISSAGNRSANLGFNAAFNAAVATELVPWLRSAFAASPDSRDVIVGGYSAGARAAADIAIQYPNQFGNVLSQSGAFAGGQIQQAYLNADRAPIRFYIDVGLYDNNAAAALPLDESSLAQGLTMANRHLRDVLTAKGYAVTYRETGGEHNWLHWRATLAEGLMTLLAPRSGRSSTH
jgi:enterochelin esterase family protein